MTASTATKHVGKTSGIADHDHDLVHELSKRLDGVWRYDQYIANAEGHDELQSFWRELKKQDQDNVSKLKALVEEEIKQSCF